MDTSSTPTPDNQLTTIEPRDRLMRDREVEAVTTLSRSQRWKLEQRGKFPARIQIGERSIGWWASQINKWLKDRQRVADVPTPAKHPNLRPRQPSPPRR
jgi:predicted DNA-binding transcriptional regulator AlpA